VIYVILGDIHGNLDALDAVLEETEQFSPDRYLCVGDIVGYGAEPSECIRRIQELDCLCIAGNHEYAVLGKTSIEYFTSEATRSIKWTQRQLSDEDLDFLDSLPLVVDEEDFTMAHGTLHNPEYFEYIQTIYDAQRSFHELDNEICFLGHSHVPVGFFDSDPIEYTLRPLIELPDSRKCLVNVGSVGQPRDQNPRASYAIYDTENRLVRIRRVRYDIESAARKIREAGLPEFNAERLYEGR